MNQENLSTHPEVNLNPNQVAMVRYAQKFFKHYRDADVDFNSIVKRAIHLYVEEHLPSLKSETSIPTLLTSML